MKMFFIFLVMSAAIFGCQQKEKTKCEVQFIASWSIHGDYDVAVIISDSMESSPQHLTAFRDNDFLFVANYFNDLNYRKENTFRFYTFSSGINDSIELTSLLNEVNTLKIEGDSDTLVVTNFKKCVSFSKL